MKHAIKHPCLFVLILIAVLALANLAAPASRVSSASDIMLNVSAQQSFPTSLTFSVNAKSDARITQLRVHYKVNRQNLASVISESWAQFSPSTNVNAQWVWDMRKSSLPPGTKVDYWWTAADAAGNTDESAHYTWTFEDDRYNWQSVTTGQVFLQWYRGSSQFANTLMDAAQQGLKRIINDTGASPQGQVRVYIYGSALELQSAQLFAQAWEGGVSFSGYNTVAVGVGVTPPEVDYGIRAVPHELTHWAIRQLTFNNYGADLPVWLNEGLATYGEGTLDLNYQAALNYAIQNNLLISVRTLSSPFSAIPQIAFISYGESDSIVRFLIQKYGKEKMMQLLKAFRDGSAHDDALKQVYGFDQDGLDALWRQSLGIRTGTSA